VTLVATRDWPAGDLESVTQCPACGGDRRLPLYEGLTDRQWFCAEGKWRLHRCLDCSAAFLDPRPDRRTIGRAYAAYYTHSSVHPEPEPPGAHSRAAARNGYLNARYGYHFRPTSRLGPALARLFPKKRSYADRLVRNLHLPSGRGQLLDIGCGQGTFLAEMRQAGWEVKGIEPDSTAAAVARANGVLVVNEPLEEAQLEPHSFDAITMNHVIEHFHDPIEALRISHRLLKRGGVLWIVTPNLASRGHALFGRDWIGLDPPRHLVLFTRSSLTRALAATGFELKGFGSDYSAQSFFPCSATIAAGEDPRDEGTVGRHRNRLSILIGDLVARFSPDRAENIVLIARSSTRGGA
jgi:2-polyprenyl-3-methyl-5-hydroxy-6-metoxy-1,4-benzoquinol methylase